MRARYVGVLSLFFTTGFFLEYTPLWRRVQIPYDLHEFHYPLADYAFQAVRQGRFPQWDPTIYCGSSFAGNVQAGLFYPLTWVMFGLALMLGQLKLSYQALEDLQLAHVWFAFLLCYLWLHQRKKLHWLASVLGSGIFAFSGYMLLQLQHLGLTCGYAWMPLGFYAIDEVDERGRWQSLWKLALASAMCLLAGYPPLWVVFAVCMIAYACARKQALKSTFWAACALAASLLFAAVQLLPAWEAALLKAPEVRYGEVSGIKDPEFYISYLVPNYFDFGLGVNIFANPGREYLYLGAPAFAGLALLAGRRRFAGAGPPTAVLLASFVFLANPFGLIGSAVSRSLFLSQIFSGYYFLAGITAAIAPLAALGLDFGLTRVRKPAPAWLALAVAGLALAWSAHLATLWMRDGLSAGWRSGLDALTATALCGALIASFAGSSRRLRTCVALGLILLAAAEYKAFGTRKRFNAHQGRFGPDYVSKPFPGMNAATYDSLRRRPEYRLALDATGPFPVELRHAGLTTPQGSDPLLSSRYQALIERIGHFSGPREFDVLPGNEPALQLLGVGYFVTSSEGSLYPQLSASSRFRLLQPDDSFYKVFELADARPSFGWEQPRADHTAEVSVWLPERRAFLVDSRAGGAFRLAEQFYPGWTAKVDGLDTAIERCQEAFQCVVLPPGEHRLEFRYRERWLIPGAIISLSFALLAAIAVVM